MSKFSRNYISIFVTILLLVTIPIIVRELYNVRDTRTRAATNTVTFKITKDLDDGYVDRDGATYPPPYQYFDTGNGYNFVVRTYKSTFPLHIIDNSLVRWDTSALPDDATITSAIVRLRVEQKYNDDSRNFVADWYSSWPIDATDSTTSGGSGTAFSVPISTITSVSDEDFTLSSPATNISKTGYTGLRFYISGGQTTGWNEVNFRDYSSAGSEFAAKLIVTFNTPDPPPPPPDTTNPSVPGNLRITGKTTSSISLDWDASSDNVGVTGYRVYRNNAGVISTAANVTSTAYSVTSLSPSTSYSYYVRAYDVAGNFSGNSNTVTATTDANPGGGSNGGGSSSGGSSSGGTTPSPIAGKPSLPPPPSSGKLDPKIVNFLKINLAVPYLSGTLKVPLLIGGFGQEVEVTQGTKDYQIDVRGAKFKLGTQLKIQAGGTHTLLTKKLTIKTKAPKQPVKFGDLWLGDLKVDNRVDRADLEDFHTFLTDGSRNGDVNADSVENSIDWATILANFGKIGDR